MKELRKKRKGLRAILLSGVVVLAGGLFMAASSPDFALGRNLQILFNLFRELNLMYVDPVDPDQMLKDAAEGMVSRLDPYTELIPESEMSDFEIMTTGKYGGMGAMIRKSGDYVMIAQPYRNFPADKAGLVIGDLLLEVNGQDIKGMEVAAVSALLKGAPGTSLKLKVKKLLSGETEEVSLKRERITISGVTYSGMVADSIGYIAHSDFTEDCSSDIRNAYMLLKKQGMKALILDLRGNGGGILQEAVKILSMFVPKGTEVVRMQGRQKQTDATFITQNEPIDTDIPLVVLVNSTSASASEIVAGALQDLDRAVLIGQRTFGKGLVQSTLPLGYNAYVKLTTAKYYIPSGRCIQAIDYAHRAEDGSVGVVPDSLIREYTTRQGRKVYDGGGIMPDVRIPASYYSNFAIALYNNGFIEDYANEYYKRHREGIDVDTFKLSESDYQDFVRFMADKTVDFQSETKEALDQLRKKAERDKYLDRISDELTAIEQKIQENKESDLVSFRDDITRLLEGEILLRYHYKEGVARHNLPTDPGVTEAVKLLNDRARYQQILSSQDTERK